MELELKLRSLMWNIDLINTRSNVCPQPLLKVTYLVSYLGFERQKGEDRDSATCFLSRTVFIHASHMHLSVLLTTEISVSKCNLRMILQASKYFISGFLCIK